MQSRAQTIVESVLGTLFAFLLSMIAALIIYPWFGFQPTPSQTFDLTLIFTAISLVRSYSVRRFFNWLHNPHRGGFASGGLLPPGDPAPSAPAPHSCPVRGECAGCHTTVLHLAEMAAHHSPTTVQGFCPQCGKLLSCVDLSTHDTHQSCASR